MLGALLPLHLNIYNLNILSIVIFTIGHIKILSVSIKSVQNENGTLNMLIFIYHLIRY